MLFAFWTILTHQQPTKTKSKSEIKKSKNLEEEDHIYILQTLISTRGFLISQ